MDDEVATVGGSAAAGTIGFAGALDPEEPVDPVWPAPVVGRAVADLVAGA